MTGNKIKYVRIDTVSPSYSTTLSTTKKWRKKTSHVLTDSVRRGGNQGVVRTENARDVRHR
jgi:hypothetical protein